MIICLVTDRRRLGAATGGSPPSQIDALIEQVQAAATAGVDVVQIRELDLEARQLTALVRTVVAELRETTTKVLVNDRLDVALAAGAHGVHARESSFAPAEIRSLAPSPFAVSCAVHTPVTATARSSADFLIAGTVLPTVSKPRADYLGWKGLTEVVAAARGTPVLGIGGLDLDSMAGLAATGAAGLAAIGAFVPPAGTSRIAEFVKKRVTALRFAFDSAQSQT